VEPQTASSGTVNNWQKKTFNKVQAFVDIELVCPNPLLKVIKRFMQMKYPSLDKEN